MMLAKYHLTYEIIYYIYSLKHRLARSCYEFEIKRVHCMMNIWNIDVFEKDCNILFFNKF